MRFRRRRFKPDYHRIAELEHELGLPPTVSESDVRWGPGIEISAADEVLRSFYTPPIYDESWLDQAIEQDRDEIAREANNARSDQHPRALLLPV